jgi:hypothetical protein
MPRACRRADCRRAGDCLGQPQTCRPELEAAVAAEDVASPADDPRDGLHMLRQALVAALAQKEAETAAALNKPSPFVPGARLGHRRASLKP